MQLLKILKVNHNGTLEDIVAQTQKAWLSPARKERWQLEESYQSEKKEALAIIEKLNLKKEIIPNERAFDYVLILGGLTKRFWARTLLLAQLIHEESIQVKNIVALVGDRPLDPKEEPIESIINGKIIKADIT